MAMKSLALLVILLVISPVSIPLASAGEPVKLDAASDASAKRSYEAMLTSLDETDRMRLAVAILQLNMIGVSGMQEVVDSQELRNPSAVRVKDRIDGKTAEEIIDLAQRTSTVKTFMVPPGQEIPSDAASAAALQ